MTNAKNIFFSVFVGGAICGLIYLGLKSNNVNYEEALTPLAESYADADANANANASASGGSRKRKGKGKKKKSLRKGKKH
jgi:hypothetical protein